MIIRRYIVDLDFVLAQQARRKSTWNASMIDQPTTTTLIVYNKMRNCQTSQYLRQQS